MRLLLALLFLLPLTAQARHKIVAPNYKSLQVVVNDDWMALPVIGLHSTDVLHISFDELSHEYHRLVYQVEPCNPDWTPCEGLFESDWLQGFNGQPIEDYENSINTTVLYTHYQFSFPNANTRVKMSGNYRLHIIDEDQDGQEVMTVEFRVVEPLARILMQVSTNTDVDLNQSHQQVSMTVQYGGLRVTNAQEQIQTFVMQNGREDNMKENVKPNYVTVQGQEWQHNKNLIFEAGNEYRKFEVLDPSHTTMGLAWITWDEEERRFHAFPYYAEPRPSYIYDEDADGAFILRNSDNIEADIASDYVYVHYKLKAERPFDHAQLRVDGRWTIEPSDVYTMQWNDVEQSYDVCVMQKLGYYNYQLLLCDLDGTTHHVPTEGSFYQTENKYEALVYYKGIGERSWRLVGYQEVKFRSQ